MSDAPDLDLLAAEYVLGTLEGDEAAEAARLLATDASFAVAVRAWEARLAPLAAGVRPVAPSSTLWDRIEASTMASGANVVPLVSRRRLRFWQAGTGAALALAASLAAFIVLRAPPPARVAVLAPMTGGVPVLVATMEPNGALIVRPDGTIAVPDGRDLELWALAAGETKPRSLGVLPASGVRVAPTRETGTLATGTRLLISLEPRGGSPTGQPTGPVLYGGTLIGRD